MPDTPAADARMPAAVRDAAVPDGAMADGAVADEVVPDGAVLSGADPEGADSEESPAEGTARPGTPSLWRDRLGPFRRQHGWLLRVARFWRRSLQFRTVASTVVLSALAISVIGAYMSISIGDDIFGSRRNQIDAEAARANRIAQQLFDDAPASGVDLAAVGVAAQQAVSASSTSPGSTGIAILRSRVQAAPTVQTLQPTSNGDFPREVVTDEMAQRIEETPGQVLLQSVLLPDGEPGIVAGSQLTVPGAGIYELYLVYDLSDARQRLGFVQQTLAVGGAALVALIGAVTYIVVRLVVGPVRVAAETSQRLAAGELTVRIPERGDDELAILARSFNGMADSLQEQITKLSELSRLQQRFVSDVSHELRTPLTTIRLAGSVLFDQRETFGPSAQRTAELLNTQVQRFESLLADLLEISRYDAGAVQLDDQSTDLVALVQESVDALSSVAIEHGTELRVSASEARVDAEVEPRRIRRVLTNLLGNAVEHGEGRPIEVSIASNETAVSIAVRDYGVGMTASATEKAFERFWRADPSRQRTIGGTGLGLAISLEDAALHDGLLEVWSKPGLGSRFRLTVPRRRGVPLGEPPLPLRPDDSPPTMPIMLPVTSESGSGSEHETGIAAEAEEAGTAAAPPGSDVAQSGHVAPSGDAAPPTRPVDA